MQRRTVILLVVLFGGLFLLFTGFLYVLYTSFGSDDGVPRGSERIGVVTVRGLISRSGRVVSSLHRFRIDPRIKAVILRVDSPGGAVGPSQEIYRELMKYRKGINGRPPKPVVASLGSVAASGGVYVASACKHVVANPGTLTGSIGVISHLFNYQGLLKLMRVKVKVYKAGKLKDTGSPFREPTAEDAKVLTGLMGQIHQQFIEDISKGRGIPKEKVKAMADGRVFTGSQAMKLKLVDRLGNFRDAVDWAAKLAGIEGRPRLVRPRRRGPSLIRALFRSAARGTAEGVVRGAPIPAPTASAGLYLLWQPHGGSR